jgi:LPS export ABC transporter permease LptF
MMRKLRNYFLAEYLYSFLISLGIFTLAFSVGNIVKIVDLIITKGIEPTMVFKLFMTMLPFSLVYTIPISTLISALLVFGKASADNEIVALKASGISAKKLSLPFMVLGIIFSLITFILMDKLLPYTHYKARETIFNIGKKNPTAYLEPGTFIKSFKNHIIFFYGKKKNILYNLRIYVSEEEKPLRTIIAEKAKILEVTDSGIKLVLYNGSSDEIDPKKPNKFYKLNFKQYTVTLGLNIGSWSKIDKKPEEYTIRELKENIRKLKRKGVDPLPLFSELHKRYAQPFICFAFILIGMSLGIKTHRREKSAGYGLGLLIVIFYYVLFISCETLILNRKLPVNIGHWVPNFVILIVGIYFYLQMDKVKK